MSMICLTHPEHTPTVCRNRANIVVPQVWVMSEYISSVIIDGNGRLVITLIGNDIWHIDVKNGNHHAFEVVCDEIFKALEGTRPT